MLALVVVLLVSNVVTIGALIVALRVRLGSELPPDPALAQALPAARGSAGHPRRVISVEIHNPIELAGHRNRMFGIAGSFVPDLTRRVVYDQTAKMLRDGLAENRVVADVRVHALIAPPPARPAAPPAPVVAPAPVADLSPLAPEFADEGAAEVGQPEQ
jgi:hypothetical protein